jgi:hypothetical protein
MGLAPGNGFCEWGGGVGAVITTRHVGLPVPDSGGQQIQRGAKLIRRVLKDVLSKAKRIYREKWRSPANDAVRCSPHPTDEKPWLKQ